MGGIAFWGGAIVAAIGLAMLYTVVRVSFHRRSDPVAATLHQPLRTSFHEAGGGPVRLRGVARVAEGATAVIEPLSGSASLWYRLEGYRPKPGMRSNSSQVSVFTEREATDIVIEDERGGTARVDVDVAGYLVPLDVFGGVRVAVSHESLPWTTHDFTDVDYHRLTERFGTAAEPVRSVRRYRLPPDSEVTVTGVLERAGEEWLITGSRPESVVIATIDDDTIRADRADRQRNRRVIGLISLAMLIVGGAATFWGFGQSF